MKEDLKVIEEKLTTDKDYIRYQRVLALWKSLGCEKMVEEFVEIDKQVGYDRVNRGSSFELRSNLIFEMI